MLVELTFLWVYLVIKYLSMQSPLQGWTYGLDGALLKATRITGIQNFNEHVCCNIILDAITFPLLFNREG